MSLPDNFILLHSGEENLRVKSISWIEQDVKLLRHAKMVECAMNLFDVFIKHHVHANKDELIVQCLGIRLFNDFSSSIKLLLSGYYQTATVLLRDVLETTFLLDYLQVNRNLIAIWSECSEMERLKQFAPAKVRIALDDRDGFTKRKREEAYKLLCGLAAHPSPEGFRMLTPIAGGNAHCGPFAEMTALEAVLSEMAKLATESANIFQRFFSKRTPLASTTSLDFMEMQGRWVEFFFDKPYDPKPIDDLRKLAKKALG
jgi:hypothetical protein